MSPVGPWILYGERSKKEKGRLRNTPAFSESSNNSSTHKEDLTDMNLDLARSQTALNETDFSMETGRMER